MFGGRFGINCSGNFKISKYHEGDLCQKSQQTSKHFVMKLICFNSSQLQISLQNSGQLQKNIVNGAMSITSNRVIK